MKPARNKEIADSLNTARAWLKATRDLNIFKTNRYKNIDRNFTGKYDIESWYQDNRRPLTDYKKKAVYRIFYDIKKMDKALEQGSKLYGKNFYYKFSQLIMHHGSKYFWCSVKKTA